MAGMIAGAGLALRWLVAIALGVWIATMARQWFQPERECRPVFVVWSDEGPT